MDFLSRVSSGAKISARSLTAWECATNLGFQCRLLLSGVTFPLCSVLGVNQQKGEQTEPFLSGRRGLLNHRAIQGTVEAESPSPAETCVPLKSQQLSYFSGTVSATLNPLHPA